MNDVLDELGRPEAVTIERLTYKATNEFAVWLRKPENRKLVSHRLNDCGYAPVRNDAAKDGLWRIHGKRQAVYGRDDLSIGDRMKAATILARQPT
jgi:hypothetical protein